MPAFRSYHEYGLALAGVRRDFVTDRQAITRKMADAGAEVAVDAASADLGGDPKFSGWSPSLAWLTVRPLRDESSLLAPTRQSAGPWTVADEGRGHRKRRRGRRNNGMTLGKHTAGDALAKMEPVLDQIAEREVAALYARRLDID